MTGPMDPDDLDGVANMFAGDRRIEALLASHDYWEAEAKRLAAEIDDARREAAALASELGGLQAEWPQALSAATAWKAEVERWRSRCPVTAEDVARRGVTWAHVWAWLTANGVSAQPIAILGSRDPTFRPPSVGSVEEMINYLVGDSPHCAQDILDEMAAMEVDP